MNNINQTGKTGWTLRDFPWIGDGPLYTGHPSPQITDQADHGVIISGCKSWAVDNVEISRHLGDGIKFSGSLGWDDVGIMRGGHIHDCYRGIHTLAGGEYANFSDVFLSSNVFGLHCDSGNNTFTGLKATKNSIGLYFSGGSNHAHGVVSGCASNHNNQNLVVYDVTIGQVFTGCNFFGHILGGSNLGSIEIARSNVSFIGGHMGSTNISLDATTKCYMRGVTFHGNVAVTVVTGTMLDARDAIVLPGAVLTLNGQPWNGNT